jgi:hypothetical protein
MVDHEPSLTIIAWKRGAKKVSNSKSEPFKLKVRPGTVQSDWDQEVFNSDWTLKPDWEVTVEVVLTRLGWEYQFRNKKTGGTYMDIDMLRHRQLWALS